MAIMPTYAPSPASRHFERFAVIREDLAGNPLLRSALKAKYTNAARGISNRNAATQEFEAA
jgi:hypothetical protein